MRASLEAAIGGCASSESLSSLQAELERRVAQLRSDIAKAEEALLGVSPRLERDLATHAKEVGAALASKASAVELQQRARTTEVETMLALKPGPPRSTRERRARSVSRPT